MGAARTSDEQKQAWIQESRDTWESIVKAEHKLGNAERCPPCFDLKHLQLSWWRKLLWRRKSDTEPYYIESCIPNYITILRHDPRWMGVLAFDEFTNETMIVRRPPWVDDDAPSRFMTGAWTDDDTTRLQSWFRRAFWFAPAREAIDAIIPIVAGHSAMHSVRQFLATLKWDKKKRLDSWLAETCGVEDSKYSSAVGRTFILGLVARASWPGCKVDLMPVFEGDQGFLKSTMLRVLAGDEWYLEHIGPVDPKETPQLFRRKWLVEFGELAAMRKTDLETFKGFVSRNVDTIRLPYARRSKDFHRQCGFAGTTNAHVYLQDETGARRYLPVRIPKPIEIDKVRAMREQLFAEACVSFWSGEPWHFGSDLVPYAAIEQDKRFQEDPWQQAIERWLDDDSERMNGVTTEQILTEALSGELVHFGRAEQTRVGAILRRMKWVVRRVEDSTGRRVRKYVAPESQVRDEDEPF